MAGSADIRGVQHYIQGIGHPKTDSPSELAPVMGLDHLRTVPLRVATFGDSTANAGNVRSVTNQDTTQAVNANWGATFSGGITADRYALDRAYPQAYLVMNGGITGQSTTQMLARDTLAASITRRAITDVINAAPDVVLFHGGSINDLSTVTAGTLAAQVATTYANHILIIQRFIAAKIPVIDVGIYGFTNGSAITATDQAATRAALVQLNAMYAAYAAQYPQWIRFVPALGVVSDSTGAYLPGMSTDGTHLNRASQLIMSQQEALALSLLFGPSAKCRYQGSNLFTNAMFANASSGLATGITTGGTNTTPSNQQIQIINGAVWQTVDFTINAVSNTSILNIAYTPQSYGLTAGDLVGMEVDILIQGLNGYSPTITGLTLRNSTFITGGSFRTESDMMAGASNGEQISSYIGHINFPPMLLGVSSSGLGTNSSIALNVQTNDASGTIRLGYANPRIVKLNNPTVVDQGSATLVAGTVTVSNSNVFPGAEIVVTCITPGGTPGALFVGTITAGTSFVINSTNAGDTSIVRWEIRGFTG